MRIGYLNIRNFKSIKKMELEDIYDALILVGKNNSGKSTVLEAVRAAVGDYTVTPKDFHEGTGNIVIGVKLSIDSDALAYLHNNGIVSQYKNYELWYEDFCKKLPSFKDGILTFVKALQPVFQLYRIY